MAEEIKSLADLPQLIREQSNTEQEQDQDQSNQQEQNQQVQIPQAAQEQRPVSKYAAKQQQRRRSLTEHPREQEHRDQNQQRHEARRSAALEDTEKWMAIVRMATSLDQISAKVENLENRLNAMVLPEQPPVDMEAIHKDLKKEISGHASSIVNLITMRLEDQAQDLRYRQKAIQTQITNEVTAAHERINVRLSDICSNVSDTRDLLRELMRRVGDPADTPISSRLREVQYITKQLELQKEQDNAPQDRTHWLPRWACQLLFDADQIHVTDHGVWTETRVGDQIDFGGSSLLELWKNIRAAKKAWKVQQKIAALQAKLNQSNTQR